MALMAVVKDSIDIRAPIDVVFKAITDPRRTMEWNSSIAGVSGLSEYPPRLGTVWRQVAMVAGRKVDLNCRITSWTVPREGVLEVTGGQRATITTRCHEVGDITRVTQTIDFVPPGGFLGSLAGGAISIAVKREMRGAMQRQKDTLEREAGGQSGSRSG
jgi:uncharacterized membrane protein